MDELQKSSGESLKALIQLFSGAAPFVGRVKAGSVDEQKRMCEVQPSSGGPKINRVYLNVVGVGDLLIVPADNSHVLCVYSLEFRNQAYIVACSKIKKILLKSNPGGVSSIEFSDAGVELKSGADGRVKIAPAGTELGTGAQKMVRGDDLMSHLEAINEKLQELGAWAATGSPPGPTGGIAPLVGFAPPTIPATLLSSKNKVE